jgi:hypothetical protein
MATVAANPGPTATSIAFMGRRYVLSRSVHHGIGVSTVYLPSGSRQGGASDMLMINYTLRHGAHHSPVTARQIAARMASTFRSLHAPLVFPFAIPDRQFPGHYIYVVTALLLMPSAQKTALIIARVRTQAAGKWIDGVIFQRVRQGHWSGSTKVTQALAPDRRWLKRHLQAVAKALAKVHAPLPPLVLR